MAISEPHRVRQYTPVLVNELLKYLLLGEEGAQDPRALPVELHLAEDLPAVVAERSLLCEALLAVNRRIERAISHINADRRLVVATRVVKALDLPARINLARFLHPQYVEIEFRGEAAQETAPRGARLIVRLPSRDLELVSSMVHDYGGHMETELAAPGDPRIRVWLPCVDDDELESPHESEEANAASGLTLPSPTLLSLSGDFLRHINLGTT